MRTTVLILLPALALLSGCGVRDGWAHHRDPLGFEVQHPQGWRAEAFGERLIRVGSADGSEFVLVYPFLLNQPTNAEQCVRQVPRLLGEWLPQARVDQVQRREGGADEAVAALRFQGAAGAGRAG